MNIEGGVKIDAHNGVWPDVADEARKLGKQLEVQPCLLVQTVDARKPVCVDFILQMLFFLQIAKKKLELPRVKVVDEFDGLLFRTAELKRADRKQYLFFHGLCGLPTLRFLSGTAT